jgi:WD40 repeat protein
VTSVAISADGKRVVSGSIDATVKIWDVETGTVVRGGVQRLGWRGVGLDFGVGFGIISTRYLQNVLYTKQPAPRIDFQEDLGGVMVSGSRSVKAQVFRIYILRQLCTRILEGGGRR